MRWWVVGIVVMGSAALALMGWRFAGEDWPTIVVAAAGILVAGVFGEVQVNLARRQADLGEVMRLLTYMPVLTGSFEPYLKQEGASVEISNVGNGPAMDMRATVLAATISTEAGLERRLLPALCDSSHLATRESTIVVARNRSPRQHGIDLARADVWIIHCADITGIHYHLVSNSDERGGPGDAADALWRWWRGKQAPSWVSENCHRCLELSGRRRHGRYKAPLPKS
jgi:hypothetical protein